MKNPIDLKQEAYDLLQSTIAISCQLPIQTPWIQNILQSIKDLEKANPNSFDFNLCQYFAAIAECTSDIGDRDGLYPTHKAFWQDRFLACLRDAI